MRIHLLLGLASVLAVTACGAGEAPTQEARPRSLLVVTIDTLRADRLGCYGHEGALTPHVDGLAARGVRFERATSVAPLTMPSHTSLFTGTIPPYHGVRDNGTYRAVPELLSLAEVLNEAGLRTAAFTAAFVLDSQFGLDQGFEVYGDIPRKAVSGGGLVEDRPAGEVNRDAFAWIDGLAPDEPFFLWVHYFEPHLPYPPPERRPPALRDRPYDAEVATADRALGELLGRLERAGRLDETLVVLTADHGESLGEHGEKTHGFFVYQGTLDVPLILAHPSLPAGEVVEERVSLVDVMPTVLDLLGHDGPQLPPPARSFAARLEGAPLADAPAYFEGMNSFLNYGWAPLHGVAVADLKLIDAPRPELYDLGADPLEAANLFERRAPDARALDAALAKLMEANARPESWSGADRDPSAEDRSKLVSLGYVGAAFPETDEEQRSLADPKDGIARIRREEEILECFNQGRPQDGAVILQEILREEPDNPVFNSRYGFLLLMQQRPADALPYLRRSVEGGYRVADNVSNLGICQLMTKDLTAAASTFEEALAIDAEHIPSLYWLSQAELQLGRRESARVHLEAIDALWQGGDEPMVMHARELLKSL